MKNTCQRERAHKVPVTPNHKAPVTSRRAEALLQGSLAAQTGICYASTHHQENNPVRKASKSGAWLAGSQPCGPFPPSSWGRGGSQDSFWPQGSHVLCYKHQQSCLPGQAQNSMAKTACASPPSSSSPSYTEREADPLQLSKVHPKRSVTPAHTMPRTGEGECCLLLCSLARSGQGRRGRPRLSAPSAHMHSHCCAPLEGCRNLSMHCSAPPTGREQAPASHRLPHRGSSHSAGFSWLAGTSP